MSDLRPIEVQAATLDAAGLNGNEISKALRITPKTVSTYRQKEEYKELKAELEAGQVAQLEPVVQRLRTEVTTGLIAAVRSLVKAANEAKFKSGSADWNARIRASEALLDKVLPMLLPDEASSSGGEQQGALPQGATLHVEIHGDTVKALEPKPVGNIAEGDDAGGA